MPLDASMDPFITYKTLHILKKLQTPSSNNHTFPWIKHLLQEKLSKSPYNSNNYKLIDPFCLNIAGRVFAYCNPKRWGAIDWAN